MHYTPGFISAKSFINKGQCVMNITHHPLKRQCVMVITHHPLKRQCVMIITHRPLKRQCVMIITHHPLKRQCVMIITHLLLLVKSCASISFLSSGGQSFSVEQCGCPPPLGCVMVITQSSFLGIEEQYLPWCYAPQQTLHRNSQQ